MKTAKELYNQTAKYYHTSLKSSFPKEYLELPVMNGLINPIISGKKVLDFGCGSGFTTRRLKEKCLKIEGIDISEKMIEIAKKECPDITFSVGGVDDLRKYNNSEFDMVVSFLVIHYIEDLEKLFKNLSRILKVGGNFVFSVRHPLLDCVLEENGKIFINKYPNKGICNWVMMNTMECNGYRHSFEEYSTALNNNGFLIEKIVEPLFTDKDFKDLENKKNYEIFTKIPMFTMFRAIKIK